MKKYLWLIVGGVLMIIDIIFLFLLYSTETLTEPTFIDWAIFVFSGIFGLPCIITQASGTTCYIIEPLTWFGIGALVGWLISRRR